MFGFLGLSCSVEIFNFHSSGQLKIGRCGYRLSLDRTFSKTGRTLIEANVNWSMGTSIKLLVPKVENLFQFFSELSEDSDINRQPNGGKKK